MNTNELDAYIAKNLYERDVDDLGGYNVTPNDEKVWHTWNPSEDYQDAFEMEDKIRELGLGYDYINQMRLAIHNNVGELDDDELFSLIHATPLQRAQACYEMLKERGQ